jgi:threonine synthase
MTPADLDSVVDDAFVAFDIDDVVRVEKLKCGLNVAELFHGPTLTFKDLGLSVIAKMYEFFLEKRKRHMTALVGEWGFKTLCINY